MKSNPATPTKNGRGSINSVPATRERTYSSDDPLTIAALAAELDGVDFLRGIAAGEIPHRRSWRHSI